MRWDRRIEGCKLRRWCRWCYRDLAAAPAPDNADTASDTNLDTRLTAGHCTYFRAIEKICVCLLFMNNPWLMAWQRHLVFFDLSEGRVRKITELGQVNF